MTTPAQSFDELSADLRAMRLEAGAPSYGVLAKRVMRQRMERGASEWEARIGRTTVYDAFQPGRRRLDEDLVRELVLALGHSSHEADQWVQRCRSAVNAAQAAKPAGPPDVDGVESRGTGSPADNGAGPENGDAPSRENGASHDAVAEPVASDGADEPTHWLPSGPWSPPDWSFKAQAVFLAGCLALNLAGRVLEHETHLALFLDMVGTAVVAVILGPWRGSLVGTATSFAGALISGWNSMPFAPIEVIGALMWGYGVRRYGWGRTIPRFFALNLIVGLLCAVAAVPIIVWVDGGFTGNGADLLTKSLDSTWHNLVAAVAGQDLLTSLADKMISGFVALVAAETVSARFGAKRRHSVQI